MSKILVVDDEPEILKVLEVFLKRSGHEAVRASGGKEAMRLLRSQSDIALVILDHLMPDMKGIEVLRDLRTHNRDLPVIVFSGDVEMHEYFREFEEYGCPRENIVGKPVDLLELGQVIERNLKQEGA